MPIEKLKIGGTEIILVGTAHISDESKKLVHETIERENPDFVGVELDHKRFMQLRMGDAWQEMNIMDIIRKGNTYLFLINILLANMQRKLGQDTGIKPGAEMLEAVNVAEEIGKPIALLDRDVTVTLKRALKNMGLVEKFKLGWMIFSSIFSQPEIEKIDEEKMRELQNKDVMSELMKAMAREMPGIKTTLVDERDAYIANRIMMCPGKKIVAVVGAGHIEGIKGNLAMPKDISKLDSLPKERNYIKWIGYAIPMIFAAFLIYAFFTKGAMTSIEMFGYWWLIVGGFSAIGALFALAHPFSIITAFVVAPFTTLHPLLAAGWFAAGVEAKMSMPKVKDFEALKSLNSYGDFMKNKVTKLLLVAAYTNIGATIGVLVGLPYLLTFLG
jgi:pheromone shutdown-related protein TraB